MIWNKKICFYPLYQVQTFKNKVVCWKIYLSKVIEYYERTFRIVYFQLQEEATGTKLSSDIIIVWRG